MTEVERIEDVFGKPHLIAQINSVITTLKNQSGQYTGNKLTRAIMALESIHQFVRQANAINTARIVFQDIEAHVDAIQQHLGTFVSDRSHFLRLMDLTDNLLLDLPKIATLDIPPFRDHAESLDKLLISFNTNVKRKEEEFSTITSLARTQIEAAQKSLLSEAESKRDRISDLLNETAQVAHLITGGSLSNQFAEQADHQRTAKRLWTGLTGGFAILTVCWLGIFLYLQLLSETATINWSLITTKVLLTLTLGLVTRWMSKRASHHLTLETKYRRLALNLATFDSYTSNLGIETKERLQAYIGANIFSEHKLHGTGDGDFDSYGLGDLLKSMATKTTVELPKSTLL